MRKVNQAKQIRVKPITKVITAIRNTNDTDKWVSWEELTGRK